MSKLKRIAAPSSWPIKRKEKKYVAIARPGPHKNNESIPLGVIVRDILHIAEDMKEVKIILRTGKIKVDGIARKSHGFPVGLMDIITAGDKHYIMMPGKKGFVLGASDGLIKLIKITNKTVVRGGKIQLNMHDGRNIVSENSYKTNDVVVFDISSKKIKDVISFKKGASVIITRGRNIGAVGKIKDIVVTKSSQPNKVSIIIGEETVEIPQKYVFLLGAERPIINMKGADL